MILAKNINAYNKMESMKNNTGANSLNVLIFITIQRLVKKSIKRQTKRFHKQICSLL